GGGGPRGDPGRRVRRVQRFGGYAVGKRGRPLPALPAGEAVRQLRGGLGKRCRPLPARPAGEAVRQLCGGLGKRCRPLPARPAGEAVVWLRRERAMDNPSPGGYPLLFIRPPGTPVAAPCFPNRFTARQTCARSISSAT